MSIEAYAVLEWLVVAAIVGAAAGFALRRWWPRRHTGPDAETGACGSTAGAACTACNGCELAQRHSAAVR
ncbi:MAG TPA: hypothetical protein VFG21_08770 [Xanthomonadaceae bacterium]|nr:hypothetical protein [Xanthomonadaceae bacterium]